MISFIDEAPGIADIEEAIDENNHKSLVEIISIMNIDLKNTRGAVATLFIIDKFAKEFEMISIDNIDSRHISRNTTERLFSYSVFFGGYIVNYKTLRRGYVVAIKGDIHLSLYRWNIL